MQRIVALCRRLRDHCHSPRGLYIYEQALSLSFIFLQLSAPGPTLLTAVDQLDELPLVSNSNSPIVARCQHSLEMITMAWRHCLLILSWITVFMRSM